MASSQHNNFQEENDLKKISNLFRKHYSLFIVFVIISLVLAFLVNRYSIPTYNISSSILIVENESQSGASAVNDFLNSGLFGKKQNFQNELWVLKSSPVLEQTIRNLDLSVTYYKKKEFRYHEAYKDTPFRVAFLPGHTQPVGVKFELTFLLEGYFQVRALSGTTSFYNIETDQITHQKDNWTFTKNAKFGELIESEDLAFIIISDSSNVTFDRTTPIYGFEINTVASISNELTKNLGFTVVDRMATVIRISLESESKEKGIDIINELMNVYSEQNLERKNHIASITIDYIERQLDEISDSLSITEDDLQRFRSSNQLLDIADQSSGISAQYLDLQNQLAVLVTRQRYYDYVSKYLSENVNFSNMIVPASLGIQDPLLNDLMSELIAVQAQRSNLVENNQERNPLVQTLSIQIENYKETISENIEAVGKTTSISIEEMNKRIGKIEGEISRLPQTQRQLGNIERKYRLNDAIYNYMMEKRAEAKITKASNLPDDIIIEPAKMVGMTPVSPNRGRNYMIAFILGLILPFAYLTVKSALNNRIETQEDIEKLTKEPVLGKILHSRLKIRNVMSEFPNSSIAETFRALRTNLDFYVRGGNKKVIMVTSCFEGEGKTFVAMNLAMSYAQLGKRTILVDFDLRKVDTYFNDAEAPNLGLSSYLLNESSLEDIIIGSPYANLSYIQSGIVPPNPVELLALEKTEKLLIRLKEAYDIIILDTTPIAQVTDAYLLVEHSELRIVVARQNLTIKRVFSFIMKDLKLKKVENICIVLNDNRIASDQYGYGYGYNNKGRSGKGRKKGRRKLT